MGECSILVKTQLLPEVSGQPKQNSGEMVKSPTESATRSCTGCDSGEALFEQVSFASVSSLGEGFLLVDPKEVIFKKELCTTYKSTVSIASWKGNIVAAKQLKVDAEEDEESHDIKMKDLVTEIKILSKINHPCLVKFLGANLHVAQPLLLTELMENQDVETYMRKQRISSADGAYKPRFSLAMRWALNTGDALAYLHGLSHPIIHRDLKPLNLFLTRNLEVKLGDFGLAKVMPTRDSDRAPKMSGGVGTWRYMAPEVLRYQQYDEKIDIFAFSLIMYFIFSGRQPFGTLQKDPDEVLRAYSRGEEPRPALHSLGNHHELRALMCRMWHADPKQRPSAQQCVEALSVIAKKSWTDLQMKFKKCSVGALLKCIPRPLGQAGAACKDFGLKRASQVLQAWPQSSAKHH